MNILWLIAKIVLLLWLAAFLLYGLSYTPLNRFLPGVFRRRPASDYDVSSINSALGRVGVGDDFCAYENGHPWRGKLCVRISSAPDRHVDFREFSDPPEGLGPIGTMHWVGDEATALRRLARLSDEEGWEGFIGAFPLYEWRYGSLTWVPGEAWF